MGHRDFYLCGLDLGSTKTCALICRRDDEGQLEVAGLGVSDSRGWRKGVIVNLDSTVLAIKKAVETAEAAAGVPFDAACVGVAGTHVQGQNSRGQLTLGRSSAASRQVTREDKINVFQAAKSVGLPPDRVLLNVLPQEYWLDAQNGIRDPIGMVGSNLEVNVHLVTASLTAHENAVTAVGRAGVEVIDTLFEPLASAEACLSPDDRELGVALLDIGGGSSDLVVYCEGTVRYTASLPIGGDHFTNDIAVGLRTPIPAAEKVKLAWGEQDENPQDAILEVPGMGERPARWVSNATVKDIIEPRSVELLELFQEELKQSGCAHQLGAGVVLAGGGAKLGGLATLAEQALGVPVRIGLPSGLKYVGDVLPDPAFATVVGLVVYADRLRLPHEPEVKGWTGKLWGLLRGKGQA